MRGLLIVGALCVLVVGGLIVLVLLDSDKQPPVAAAISEPLNNTSEPAESMRRYTQDRGRRVMPDEVREKQIAQASKDADSDKVLKLGHEFHAKWYADRSKLGEERHKQMEKLWFEGRRPRGNPESIEKLEKLLDEYPDTNRAGCAAYELGQHYMRDRALTLDQRRKKAQKYWGLTEERYGDSLCEFNEHPATMAELGMANWIYRKTDPAMARRLLDDIIKNHKGEADHLGQPVETLARRMLEQIK
ncbi:MAG TPA: hypothetical protein VM425_02780 [Myxococcota bacterium]|nr:hypothetical protein [Myxococcota bacterium]